MKVTLEAQDLKPGRRLTDDEFKFCYERVIRVCVDLVLVVDGKVLLSRRNVDPYKGMWNTLGGTVRRGELSADALARVVFGEVGITIFPSELKRIQYYENLNDGPYDNVGWYLLGTRYEGKPKLGWEIEEFRFFDTVPDDMIPHQAKFLKEYWQEIMERAR